MHWVDYAIIAIIGLSVITGLFRGFVKELVSLTAWVLAIWLGMNYSQVCAPWLAPYIHDQSIRMVIAFILVVIVTVILGAMVNVTLSFVLRRSGLSGTDRLLGLIFGFVRGVFIMALIMLVVKMTDMPYQEYKQQSLLYTRFDPVVNWLYGFTPNLIHQMKALDPSTTPSEVPTM